MNTDRAFVAVEDLLSHSDLSENFISLLEQQAPIQFRYLCARNLLYPEVVKMGAE